MATRKKTIEVLNAEVPVEATTSTISSVLSNYDMNIIQGLETCIALNESALLIGETGTGKTTLVNELAKQKGKVLHRVSVNGSMGVDEILGKWLAKDGSTYWIDGILTAAVRKGEWVIFDEMNALLPEMGFALHSLLDDAKTITLAEKDGELIPAHPEFRFFGSMNPSDEYAGTKEVNMALMSRFGGVFYIEVFPTHHELQVLTRNGVEEGHATKLVNLANQLRQMREKGDLFTFISTRDIIQAGKLATSGLNLALAVEFAVMNKMTKDEKDELKKSSVMKDYLAGKAFMSPEVEKAEKELRETKSELKKYKDAHDEVIKQRAEALRQLEEEKKKSTGISVDGIDPRKLLLLKRLMGDELGL